MEEVLVVNVKHHRRRGTLRLAYGTLILFMVVYFARPEDWIPGLAGFPVAKIAGILMVLALVFSVGSIDWEFSWEIVLLCLLVIQLWLTVPFSPVWKGGAFNVMLDFSKMLPLVVCIFATVRSMTRLRWVLIVQSVSIAAIAVASVVQAHTRDGRLQGALLGMYGNPNDLALAIDLSLPLCLVLALTTRSYTRRLAWAGAMLVMIYAVFLTASRAGAVALAVVAAMSYWQLGLKSGRISVLVFLPIALIVLAIYGGRSLHERFVQRSDDSIAVGQTTEASESFQQRKELLLKSLRVTADHPLLGIGPGNFVVVSGFWRVSHNSYTQMSAEGGIPAFILYLLILWRAIANLRDLRKFGELRKEIRLFSFALEASLMGYLVGSFFASVAYLLFPYCSMAYTSSLVLVVQRERFLLLRRPQSDLAPAPVELTA